MGCGELIPWFALLACAAFAQLLMVDEKLNSTKLKADVPFAVRSVYCAEPLLSQAAVRNRAMLQQCVYTPVLLTVPKTIQLC